MNTISITTTISVLLWAIYERSCMLGQLKCVPYSFHNVSVCEGCFICLSGRKVIMQAYINAGL